MAIDRTGISSLDTGASDITYSGDEGPKSPQEEMQIAGGEYNRVLEILEKVRENIPLSEEEKMELQGLIKTLTAKGIPVEQLMGQEQGREGIQMASAADPMLEEQYEQYIFEMEEQGIEPMSFEQFRQQAVAGMAEGGIARLGYDMGGNVRQRPHQPSDLLVRNTLSGERPKYQPPGGGATSLGSRRDYSPGPSDRGPREDPDRFGTTQAPPRALHHPGPDKTVVPVPITIGHDPVTIPKDKDDGDNWLKKQLEARAKTAYNLVPNKFSWTYDKRKRFIASLSDPEKRALGYNFNVDWDDLDDEEKDRLMSYDVYSDLNELGYQDWLAKDYEDKFGPRGGGEGQARELNQLYSNYIPGQGGGGGTTPPEEDPDPFPTDPVTATALTNQYNIPGASNFYSNLPSTMFNPATNMLTLADGGRAGYAGGGIADLRQAYGLGSLVKKIGRTIKKVAKSPLGKAALIGLGGWGASKMFPGMMPGLKDSSFLKSMLLKGGEGSWSMANISPWKAIGGLSALGGLYTSMTDDDDEKPEWLKRWLADKAAADAQFAGISDPSNLQPIRFAAQGGRIGYQNGRSARSVALNQMYGITPKRKMAQEGGLMDMGGMEKDYREEGGFVPIGGQERADDVPARLSKNEFVFTADAVRAAGGGDIDKGAEVMENVMENLEQGGQVSEESQGLEGARNMFATAQRLEGVL